MPNVSDTPRLAERSLQRARALLGSVWEYSEFRYHQRRAVLAALRERDCLAVLPTGGGKSLCFQVPALMLPGVTLVISPLISLMQDQVRALRTRGVPAAYLSSTQRPEVQRAVRDALTTGRIKLLYVAPERMQQIVELLAPTTVSLLAVDEAHCISEWGHDFRPHYRSLGRHRSALGNPPTMAVTATATPSVRRDIVDVLRLRRPVVVTQSFDRPNLFFRAVRVEGEGRRVSLLARQVKQVHGTAIVYVPTRNRTDGVTAVLRRWGIRAAPYHAGLPAPARRALLKRFLEDRVQVMVATNAFGMGIDKPDIRLVLHLGVPARPESYFQEAGRAGRDGQPAHCLMLWTVGDLALATRMALSEARRRDAQSASHRTAQRRGLETMRRYVHSRHCRRRVLLEYLGERLKGCSGCDRCHRSEPWRAG